VHDVNGNAFYKEVTKLERVSTASGDMPMLYKTGFIANYWANLASKVSGCTFEPSSLPNIGE